MSVASSSRLKRAVDIVGASAGLALLSPLMIGAAFGIRRNLGKGAVLFKQARPGLKEKIFTVVKFRSMLGEFDENGTELSFEERLIPYGIKLRKLSIDELPQLINVLRGEMSLVGPRPFPVEFLEKYPPEYRRRHDVKPGLTGWAQVNGRHRSTYSQRFGNDVWYVDNWSFKLDIEILYKTVVHILFSSDILMPDQSIEDIDDLGIVVPLEGR